MSFVLFKHAKDNICINYTLLSFFKMPMDNISKTLMSNPNMQKTNQYRMAGDVFGRS